MNTNLRIKLPAKHPGVGYAENKRYNSEKAKIRFTFRARPEYPMGMASDDRTKTQIKHDK